MDKLYIHIGTHKTGTTTVQKYLRENNHKLEDEGITFLYKPNAFLRLGTIEIIEKKFIEKGIDELENWIRSKKPNGISTFISSHEDLSGGWRTGYKNSHMVAKNLQMMLSELGLDIQIIVYLRRQDSFIESLYTQSVQSGNPNNFDDFLKSYDDDSFNWYNLISNYAECFGKERIHIHTYEKNRLSRPESILNEFGEIIGSDFLQSYIKLEARNQGYTRDALEIAKLTTPYISREENEHLRNVFQQINSKQPFESYTYFNPDQRAGYLSKYEISNNKLAKEYLNKEQLFDLKDLDNSNQKIYPGLTLESAVITLTKALVVLSRDNDMIKKRLEQKEKVTLGTRLKKYVKRQLNR
jgi:hypothetical protein